MRINPWVGLLVVVALACGDPSPVEPSGNTDTPEPTLSLRVGATTVLPGNSIELRATVTGPDDFNRSVRWTLLGSGMLSSTHGAAVTYLAAENPVQQEQVVITVTSTAKPGLTASVTLTLAGPSVRIVSLRSERASLFAGESTDVTAQVGVFGDSSQEVRWSLEGPGALSAAAGPRVTYRAPSRVEAVGTATLTVTPVERPDRAESVVLSLLPSHLTEVRLAASTGTADALSVVELTAEVVGTGRFSQEVDWSVPPGGGVLRPLPADPAQPHLRRALFTPSDVTAETVVEVRASARVDAAYGAAATLRVRPVTMPASGGLRIEEVGATWRWNPPYSDYRPCWLEVRNTSSQPVPLAGYALRTHSIDWPNLRLEQGLRTFPLPARTLAPGGRLLLMAGARSNAPSHVLAFVRDETSSIVPFWQPHGFVELVRQDTGASVDFVRFGDSTEAPSAGGAWSGPNLPPLEGPTWTSLARVDDADDHDGAADWARARFGTPGGPNDVPPEAEDADADGIPDTAEVPGGRFAGLDLYALGARVAQRDIFVEVDYLQSTDKGVTPRREAFDKVVAAFARRGFRLHVDVGTAYSGTFDPARYNLGQGNPVQPYARAIRLAADSQVPVGVWDLRDANQHVARQSIFHYAVFGTSAQPDGSISFGGVADLVGPHLLVLLGGAGLDDETPERQNLLINTQAVTFMHELGHSLGLEHSGPVTADSCNYKPNYLSVMNYLYAMSGLGPVDGPHAGDRYYYWRQMKGYSTYRDLQDSPLSSTFVLDYSDGRGSPINEAAVDEARGLGRPGASWVDFDGSGTVNMPSLDVDACAGISATPVRDFDDWGSLILAFSRYLQPSPPPRPKQQSRALVEPRRAFVEEPPLTPAVLEQLRGAGRHPRP